MTPFTRAALLPFAFLAASWAEDKPLGLTKDSPFTDRRKPAAQLAAASETIEFAGVSALGKRTDLVIHDKSSKKSHWITEGETKEGITVLKYDARREQVVVKVNGVEKILQLRKGSGPVNTVAGVAPVPGGFNVPPALPPAVQKIQPPPPSGAPTSLPADPTLAAVAQPAPKPDGPATPETQQKQETEARMLVSDLLEIGMAQRKAYEDAQRRAASGESAPPAAAADAPAPTTTQPDKPQP